MSTSASLDGIAWVRLTFIDVFGTSNSVQIPAERFPDALERGVPFDGSALEGRARLIESDMLLRPDPATLVDLGDGVARAVCTVHTPDSARWPSDPRFALESVLEASGDLGQCMTVTAELEFYLVDQAAISIDAAGYYDEAESVGSDLLRTAAERLAACGVVVDSGHHEAGPGQYELDLAPLGALQLADGLVLAKQVVRDVARARGIRATFMARPFSGLAGSGLHLHQRVPGLLLDEVGKLEPQGRSFLAGQLVHARALSALAAPTVNSYKRLHTGPEAPGAIVWAHMNRGALLRVSSYRGADASLEYRGADPSANPYLILAGLLAAGLDGVERDLDLPAATEEVAGGYDPAGTEQRVQPLPRNLEDALDALIADDVIIDAFDDQLIARLIDGRRAEALAYHSLVTDWERNRYLDNA